MATHQSALTSILDFFPLSEVATMQQTDSVAHKLKLRSFYKSAHLWVHSANFYPSVNHAWYFYTLSLNKLANSSANVLSVVATKCAIFNNLSVKRLVLPRLFSSIFFGWAVFCNSLSYLYSSAYLLSYTLDSFKLYTNTSNQLDMLFNSLS